jgi:hypothetical protein
MVSLGRVPALLFVFSPLLVSGCSSKGDDGSCNPGDQDGVVGGMLTVLLSVSDSGYAVGGVDSGSTEPNIAAQNRSNVMLTLTNVGTAPHGMQIACLRSSTACAPLSCFPDAANIPALDPGAGATVTFVTPALEGAYPFTDPAHDMTANGEGGVDGSAAGLVGEFVLL